MKHSLSLKLTLILVFSLTSMIALCWLLNNSFLADYYQINKVSSLCDSYSSLNKIAGSEDIEIDDAVCSGIEKIETSYNVNVYMFSETVSFLGYSQLSYIYPIVMDTAHGGLDFFRSENYNRVTSALKQYVFGEYDKRTNTKLLKTEQNRFDVYKYFDPDVNSFYIDLVGLLDNGNLVFIRSSYENIEESAAISSKFLAIVGCFIIIVGSIFMLLFSRRFTKPILELADISDKMANLDFDTKYNGRRKDEIGKLGVSMNVLSSKLESTITELKSANIELEKDIAKKNEIDEMRKEFLSNVSHELKTPIALIQGYAEGLQDNVNDDPESRNYYCEVIIDEAHKMNNMVKKLLSLNQLEAGVNRLELEHFDIVEMVQSLVQSVNILCVSKNIKILVNEHEPVIVWGDMNMIEEVITNYLSNAINHAEGARIIDISFKINKDKLRTSVFNTGDNIPEEDIDNIWDKFYKVDKARTREYGGSGIGLSIVKAIMEQHNQAYGVKNHTAGVEFWFELDMKNNE